VIAVVIPGVVGLLALALMGRFPQDPGYHTFADLRVIWGIPHFGDVVSNLAFILVGLHGLWVALRERGMHGRSPFADRRERVAYLVLFGGVICSGLGSAYYHFEPDNVSLFWDRLPMTIVFAALMSILLSERLSARAGRLALLPALVVALSAVIYWHLSELAGRGDVRFYGLVQFYPLVGGALLLALFRPRYTRGHYFWALFAAYGVAKVCEESDASILDLNGFVSGHSLKHVCAAMGVWILVGMLRKREAFRADPAPGGT
jgi:hypothetical protein